MAQEFNATKSNSSLKEELLAEQNKLKQANKRTLVIASIIVAIVFGYFSFIYIKLQQAVQPAALAEIIQGKICELTPVIAKKVERELIKTAPELSQRMAQNCVNSAPQARKAVEQLICETTDELLALMRKSLVETLLESIRRNKSQIQELINTMHDKGGRKETTEALKAELTKSFNEEGGKKYLGYYEDIFTDISGELKYLGTAAERELSEEQLLEKELIRTFRTMIHRRLLAPGVEIEEIK